VPASSFFDGVQRFAGQVLGQAQRSYSALDRASGGWLPGGGTASPLTRSAQDVNRFVNTVPQAQVKPFSQEFKNIQGATPNSPVWDYQTRTLTPQAKEVLRQLGQNPDVTWDLNKTNPVAQLGDKLGYSSGMTAHANPLKNQIFMPLSTTSDLKTLIHEAGHLNTSQRTGIRPPFEGIFGQILATPAAAIKEVTGGELSPFRPLLAPLRMAGGLLMAHSDAKEEDYAEKFTQDATRGMFGKSVNAEGGTGDFGFRNKPSAYAERLYSRGAASLSEGISDTVPDLFKVIPGAVSGVTQYQLGSFR